MVPGFVQLGIGAVLVQLLVLGGLYGYLHHRHPVTDATARRRTATALVAGTTLAMLGQLATLGAMGVLHVSPLLSFEQALLVQELGLLCAVGGYVGVGAGLVLHSKAS